MAGIAVSSAAIAVTGSVHFIGDFESGQIKGNGYPYDGFYIATLPDPQSGSTFLNNQDSDFGPSSNADTHVVRSESVGGQTIKPRGGEYFLRSEIFRNKNYLALNDFKKNRPRSKLYMTNSNLLIDFDQEGYIGFSIFVPKNFQSERGVKDHRGALTLFTIAGGGGQLVDLSQWVQSPATEAHWFIRYWTRTTNGTVKITKVDLGPVSADAGKWTDFVFRYRFNPFSTATNWKSKSYPGNKGILQVWKAQGAVNSQGDRSMAQKVDKVNTPVGLAPSSQKISHHFRLYKFGWLTHPTTVDRPVWIGFDEIRQGMVNRDGTTFAKVAPANFTS
jgi:hypothetical protein